VPAGILRYALDHILNVAAARHFNKSEGPEVFPVPEIYYDSLLKPWGWVMFVLGSWSRDMGYEFIRPKRHVQTSHFVWVLAWK
jgi:hypothetical protein